jgi:hypothetical protein
MNDEDRTETARSGRSGRALEGDQPDDDPAANLELIVASTLGDGDEDAVIDDVDGVTEASSRLETRALAGKQPSPAGPERGGTDR